MLILGLHIGHDSSVTLLEDGRILASAAEERFVRVKHFGGLPLHAAKYCLSSQGVTLENIDKIAYCGHLLDKRLNQLFNLPAAASYDIENANWSLKESLRSRLRDMVKHYNLPPRYFPAIHLPQKTPIRYVPHHLCHAASAYYTSGNSEKTLVITSDGAGEEGNSLTVWLGDGGKLTHLRSYDTRHSLGFFYAVVTEALGWWVGDGEGTVMGLAPYGDPGAVPDDVFDGLTPVFRDGEFEAPIEFGTIGAFEYMDTYHWSFGATPKAEELREKYGRENLAAKVQEVLEKQLMAFVSHWQRETGCERLAAAGGVFLNVKANQKIVESGLFKDFFIYPDAGDSGTSAGAALQVSAEETGKMPAERIRDVYWGPSYSTDEIRSLLDERRLPYTESANVAAECAKELADGKIVAWFQGRMECGPRALGGRSIVYDARKAENKDVINSSVKFREPFRPFCPSMKAESAAGYLKGAERIERYMITAYEVLPERRDDIAAVTHVDGTARPQMVEKDVYPLFWQLLDEYDKLTGSPVLMNTSFNIKGEPIVCTPRDAIKCFYDTGIDVLALGPFILRK